MKKYILSSLVVCVVIFAVGCFKDIENGFLSDQIRYINSLVYIYRGAQSANSVALTPDGSTTPIRYKYANLRDEAGHPVSDSFFMKYPVTTWKSGMGYVWAEDTTEALVDAKRETSMLLPINFNEATGAWSSNSGSVNLPTGDFPFDIEATNSWGTKTFPNLGKLRIMDYTVDNCWTGVTYNTAAFYKNPSSTLGTLPSNTAPTITMVRDSAQGTTLRVKVMDKNGVLFDPSKSEVRYYSTSATYPSLESYSKIHPVTYENSMYNINYYATPFPYRYYYIIYSILYSATGDNANAVPANNMYSYSIMRWQITQPGSYTMTVQYKNLLHK